MLNCDNFDKVFENVSLAARMAFVEYFNGYDNNYLEIEEEDLDTFIEVMNESLNLMKEELLKQQRNYKTALNEAFGALNEAFGSLNEVFGALNKIARNLK